MECQDHSLAEAVDLAGSRRGISLEETYSSRLCGILPRDTGRQSGFTQRRCRGRVSAVGFMLFLASSLSYITSAFCSGYATGAGNAYHHHECYREICHAVRMYLWNLSRNIRFRCGVTVFGCSRRSMLEKTLCR